MKDKKSVNFQCDLYLLVKHPCISPDNITENLSLEPNLTQKSGCQIKTPNGSTLSNSYNWSTWQYIKPILEKDKLLSELEYLVSHLEQCEVFIRELIATNAKVSIFFRSMISSHVPFMLEAELMKKLGALGVDFGFEFFPNQ